jgi:hypothetical protein
MVKADFTIRTIPMDFPAGTVPGAWRISVSGAANESQDVTDPKASFSLPAGDYTVSAQRLDAGGNPLGPLVSDSFSVSEPTGVTIDVADGITVTFGA